MKKKVKLEEVESKGWEVAESDKKTVRTAKTTIANNKAMGTMVKNSETSLALTEKLIAAVEALPAKMVPATPAAIVRADAAKKKFRFSISRDKDGFIEYVDVNQI